GQVDPTGRKIGESDGNENTVLGGTPKEGEGGETNMRLGAVEDDFFDVDKTTANSAKKTGGKKVTREREELGKLPTWVRDTRTMPSKSFVVDPRATGKQDYSTLNLALRDLPREGGRIILTGPGPFPVRVDHIRDCGRVVIEAADEADHPLIVLLEPDNASVHAFLTFENTSLELNNVHIATNVTGFSTSASDALIHVHGGDLLARGCSFSARGVPNTGMTALRVTSPAAGIKSSATKATEDNGRRNILVSKCVVRGRKLTSVLAEVPRGEVVIHDSLLLSGDSPALRLGGAEGDGAGVRNRLILSAATVVAAQNALECTLPSSLNSDWQIALVSTNSLVSTSDASAAGSLLKVLSLEADKAPTILGKKLRWKTTSSLFPGWKALIKLEGEGTPLATSFTQWQLLWQDSGVSAKNFPRKGWPVDFPADVCETSLGVFDRETLGSADVVVAGGGNPGCSVKDLQSTGLAGMDSMLTMGRRPLVPDGIFGDRGVVEELRVDLTREDLGKVLASKKLSNGTTVIASGAGVCVSSPVVIRDAWIRLRFAQTPGKPLVLMPKQNTAPDNSPDALISVIHGGIEIQGGVLLAAGLGSKVSAPKYLISAIDSDVALNQCRLQGVLGGAAGRSKGLIEWRSSDNPVAPSRPFASDRLAYLVVGESFLLGSGTLIDADVGQRVLLFHRSVALSRNDLFSLRMRESDGAMEGVVDLEQSTLSALDTYLKVDSPTTVRGAVSPLQFYADRCVFGPALKRTGRGQPSTLMAVAGSALAGGQIRWWEISCGYAPDVGCLLRDDTETPVVQDFKEKWVQKWGADNCLSPLVGPQEIVLRDELPAKPGELSDLETSRFALHSNCRAASWDGGASPIGARVDQLHVPSPQVAFTPSGSKKAKPNKPKQNVEGF
ncbi:MAG: hypothetical protein NT069_15575, partial [Planctomycetota bacterium]|nr:hypothetical protein [Planctomycetota bacterium]